MWYPFKFTIKIMLYCAVAVLCVLLFFRYNVRSFSEPLPKECLHILEREADSCAASADVPVAAGVWYRGELIGSAHNTVSEKAEAGGHAEINAISKALKTLGYKDFMQLDRDSLLLVSTFEPCAMCSGAITEYNIRKVVYIEKKGIWYRLRREDWPLWRYYCQRKYFENDLQKRKFEERRESNIK